MQLIYCLEEFYLSLLFGMTPTVLQELNVQLPRFVDRISLGLVFDRGCSIHLKRRIMLIFCFDYEEGVVVAAKHFFISYVCLLG